MVGGDVKVVCDGCFELFVELMVVYVYDVINCGNLVGFFGMVYVFEGISVVLVLMVVDKI